MIKKTTKQFLKFESIFFSRVVPIADNRDFNVYYVQYV